MYFIMVFFGNGSVINFTKDTPEDFDQTMLELIKLERCGMVDQVVVLTMRG